MLRVTHVPGRAATPNITGTSGSRRLNAMHLVISAWKTGQITAPVLFIRAYR